MMELVTPIYRCEDATELNNLIESLIKDLEMESEAVSETLMDLTLNPTEQREKTFWEVVGNPENYQEILTLKSRNETLEFIVSELKGIVYSDYKIRPAFKQKTTEPRMSKEECQIWLGTKVKPLILNGKTKQQDISEVLNVGASTISTRVKSGYSKSWKDYVELVTQGIY